MLNEAKVAPIDVATVGAQKQLLGKRLKRKDGGRPTVDQEAMLQGDNDPFELGHRRIASKYAMALLKGATGRGPHEWGSALIGRLRSRRTCSPHGEDQREERTLALGTAGSWPHV